MAGAATAGIRVPAIIRAGRTSSAEDAMVRIDMFERRVAGGARAALRGRAASVHGLA